MAELPWFKFVIADWMLDRSLAKCSSATRGVWLELIIAMHQDGRSGELRETVDHMAQLARTTTAIMDQALTELQTTGTADVTFRNTIVTVVNRKMKREFKSRTGTALRVQKHRSNKDVTPGVTVQSKDLRVKSKEEEKSPPMDLVTWDDEKRKFFEDGGWQFKFSGQKNVAFDVLENHMKEFVTDLDLKSEYKDFRELQRHFTNWYNVRKTKGTGKIHASAQTAAAPLKKLKPI